MDGDINHKRRHCPELRPKNKEESTFASGRESNLGVRTASTKCLEVKVFVSY